MIRFLTTRRRAATLADWLAGPGATYADRIRPVFYEDVLQRRAEIVGSDVWIVADYDKLGTDDALSASALWQKLHEAGCRILNHPTRSMRRYELMRTLFEARVNAFNIYRVVDLRPPQRFPVFLRRFDDHAGPLTGQLSDAEALAKATEHAYEAGWPMDWLAIVEFAETVEPDGLYRVRSAMRIGEALFPLHVLSRDRWVVKDPGDGRWDAAAEDSEADHLGRFAERDAVAEAFRLARIDYGRIDYSRAGAGIQVWEIDPSPELFGTAARMPERAAAAAAGLASIASAFDRLLAVGAAA